MDAVNTWSKQCSIVVQNDLKALRHALASGAYEAYKPSPVQQFSLLHVGRRLCFALLRRRSRC
jgi:hypothetical protein